jgi:hypothetical protein
MTKITAIVFLALLIPMTASGQSPLTEGHVFIGGGSAFVSDVTIPDGTVMAPGQSFTKTWKLKNIGTTSWSNYSLTFFYGEQMGAPSSVSVPMTPPGATVDISVPMTAPKDAGGHKGSWQMTTPDGKFFGQDVFVLIDVKSSTYEGRTFEDWETDLQSHSPAVREKALKELNRFGQRATSALIKIFRSDPDEKVRGLALAALGDIKPPSNDAIRVFLGAATDPSPLISWTAIMFFQEALPSQIAPEMVPILIEAMRDANPIRRQLAIKSLALGPAAKEAAPTLHELADHDPEPEVRNIANEALKLIERRSMVSGDK